MSQSPQHHLRTYILRKIFSQFIGISSPSDQEVHTTSLCSMLVAFCKILVGKRLPENLILNLFEHVYAQAKFPEGKATAGATIMANAEAHTTQCVPLIWLKGTNASLRSFPIYIKNRISDLAGLQENMFIWYSAFGVDRPSSAMFATT